MVIQRYDAVIECVWLYTVLSRVIGSWFKHSAQSWTGLYRFERWNITYSYWLHGIQHKVLYVLIQWESLVNWNIACNSGEYCMAMDLMTKEPFRTELVGVFYRTYGWYQPWPWHCWLNYDLRNGLICIHVWMKMRGKNGYYAASKVTKFAMHVGLSADNWVTRTIIIWTLLATNTAKGEYSLGDLSLFCLRNNIMNNSMYTYPKLVSLDPLCKKILVEYEHRLFLIAKKDTHMSMHCWLMLTFCFYTQHHFEYTVITTLSSLNNLHLISMPFNWKGKTASNFQNQVDTMSI